MINAENKFRQWAETLIKNSIKGYQNKYMPWKTMAYQDVSKVFENNIQHQIQIFKT